MVSFYLNLTMERVPPKKLCLRHKASLEHGGYNFRMPSFVIIPVYVRWMSKLRTVTSESCYLSSFKCINLFKCKSN